jgi:peptidoglycan/LPS O-acetylase OafA/YrhL
MGIEYDSRRFRRGCPMGSLRTLFALSVVLGHSPWHGGILFVGAPNAVQLFYMTSGFVIAHVLATVPAYGDVRTFYASRILRLYPAYFAVAALALAWEFAADDRVSGALRAAPAAAAAFLAVVNATLVGQDWTLFMAVRNGDWVLTGDFYASEVPLWKGLLVPQAWTLGLELVFYAMAPFLVRRRGLLITLFVASLAARAAAIAAGFGGRDPWTYRFFPFELALFLAGVLSYQLLLPAWRRVVAAASRHWIPGLATGALLAGCAAYAFIPGEPGIKAAVLFLAYAAFMPLAFLFQQRSRVDDALGDLSYPLYLVHFLVVGMATRAFDQAGLGNDWIRLSIYLAACLAAALALHHFVVRPVERWRTALRQRVPAAAA